MYSISYAALDTFRSRHESATQIHLLGVSSGATTVVRHGALPRSKSLCTPTRLYVVEERTKLAAFLDVFQE